MCLFQGEKAIELLPLAIEYNIAPLQNMCEEKFKGGCCPSLMMAGLAEKSDLKEC